MFTLIKLTWVELKIFAREPLGVFGTIAMPVIVFMVLGRVVGGGSRQLSARQAAIAGIDVPVLGALLIALSGVLSLVTIVSIYRESGILKRLRATPLRPSAILVAHVLVKLLLTVATLALMVVAGRRYFPPGMDVPLVRFTAAMLFTTVTLLSVGFVLASVVPSARLAQPIATLVLYPMIGISGLFAPIDALPPGVG